MPFFRRDAHLLKASWVFGEHVEERTFCLFLPFPTNLAKKWSIKCSKVDCCSFKTQKDNVKSKGTVCWGLVGRWESQKAGKNRVFRLLFLWMVTSCVNLQEQGYGCRHWQWTRLAMCVMRKILESTHGRCSQLAKKYFWEITGFHKWFWCWTG